MEAKKNTVLMLGWEFPPVFTGGLGIACYNIVKALQAHANIHLVIPFVEDGSTSDGITITGANRLEPADGSVLLQDDAYSLLVSKVYKVPVHLEAYPGSGPGALSSTETELGSIQKFATLADISSQYFQSRDIYGYDVRVRTRLFAKVVERIASRISFDVIHAHDWPTFDAAIAAKYLTGKPVVLHIHALETDRSGSDVRNDIYHLEKWAMEHADSVIAVSQYTRQQIMLRYGIDGDKIKVALNGAEATERSTYAKTADEKWITFVGRLVSQKGPLFLLETADKLIRLCPEVRFVIAGTGHLLPWMLNEVARRRLGRYFIFTGFLSREKVYDLLAASEAYFMPSVSEPFGLSAIEAAQHGAASVISSHSGAAEVLASALRADFWDTDKFANYLFALIRYPVLRKTITTQLREDIKDLTWDNTADSILHVYDELITT